MMNKVSVLAVTTVVLASLLSGGEAACASNCNGHGTCGAWDRCSCYSSFDYANAEDCSYRVCPYGETRGQTGTDTHGYTECSGNGICNRKSGECECSEGFTGAACHRTTCPSDCNGRGQCQTIQTFNSGYNTAWDRDQTQVCKCDPGYEGPACERRMCPKGDDPLSLQSGIGNGNQVDEVQTITFALTPGAFDDTAFTIKFTDWMGQVHETRPISIRTVTASEIKEAFAAFPNNVIPSCTVAVTGSGGSFNTAVVITVTFDATENSGTQNLLEIDDGAKTAGMHPIKSAISSTGGSYDGVTVVRTTTGTEESKVCAGRGICDTELGECNCFVGFYGHSCSMQTALQ